LSVCVLILALIPHTATAKLDDCTVTAQLVEGHATIHLVPSDTIALGDFVGTDNRSYIVFRCKVSGSPTQWAAIRQNHGFLSEISSVIPHPSGGSVSLTMPQLQQYGLGYTGQHWHQGTNGPVPTFIPHNSQGGVSYVWSALPPTDSEGYVELGIHVTYRFHKINNNLDAVLNGNLTVQPFSVTPVTFAVRDNQSTTLSPPAEFTFTMPTLTIAQRACTPFTNSVTLPTVHANDLPAIGSHGPEQDFWIQMRCPSNLAYIGYYIVPVHGIANEAQGVININPASAAKGIGLRITTRSTAEGIYYSKIAAVYHPVKFGSTNRYRVHSSLRYGAGVDTDPLTTETDHTAPLDTIPLKVAVYRTGTVVPGSYNAAIYIHLVYR